MEIGWRKMAVENGAQGKRKSLGVAWFMEVDLEEWARGC